MSEEELISEKARLNESLNDMKNTMAEVGAIIKSGKMTSDQKVDKVKELLK